VGTVATTRGRPWHGCGAILKDRLNRRITMPFTRITVDADQMGGIPCIRGLRIPVATVVAMVAEGMAPEEILKAYPDLETDDIREALHYASAALR
jgi:uncharacterized protein (DUF433 family)